MLAGFPLKFSRSQETDRKTDRKPPAPHQKRPSTIPVTTPIPPLVKFFSLSVFVSSCVTRDLIGLVDTEPKMDEEGVLNERQTMQVPPDEIRDDLSGNFLPLHAADFVKPLSFNEYSLTLNSR